ncbi:ankyrin repeat domain-containing protein [Rubinisphaera margarita]|uniref:ankyrin repeat domain-containing protein n=1 Tax=Rubinisphaera margarita TaxID=2909586 RepID=UPI001EE8C025|nr:ankyrin repeat domain-containing protein [Rubinisphaera margarita]MCG6157829.1 ankyrin repeat domain-containing protein [Rubinisphaera margarita]
MKKLERSLYALAAVGVIIVIAVNVHFYRVRQYQDYLRSLGLHQAAIHHPELIPEILKLGADINALNKEGYTALHLAATFKKIESVETLLKLGADPDVKCHKDRINPTVLHRATFTLNDAKQVRMTILLLEAGADPNVVTSEIETPLLRLAGTSHSFSVSVAQELISAGADVNIADSRGMTPLQYAVARRNPQLADVLLQAGADPEQRNDAGFRAIDQLNLVPNPEAMQKIFEKHGADSVRRPELFTKYRKEK